MQITQLIIIVHLPNFFVLNNLDVTTQLRTSYQKHDFLIQTNGYDKIKSMPK